MIAYLLSAIAALLGYAWFERSKRKSAEAQNDNLESRGEVKEHQALAGANEKQLQSEQEARTTVQATLERELGRKLTDEELARYLNRK